MIQDPNFPIYTKAFQQVVGICVLRKFDQKNKALDFSKANDIKQAI